MTTPILFLIFRRPDTTKLVFEEIRKARPTKLYIVADGPRENRPDDIDKCAETRQIVTGVDWPCEVHTLFREMNLGLGEGVTAGITWFFDHEEEGIILEDDCLPSQSFFLFCAEMLERYRYDTRIMEIGANNLEDIDLRDTEYSYRFSSLVYIWGWATWKRAWKLHDFEMSHYPEVSKKKYLDYSYESIYEHDFFQYVFEKMYKGDEKTNRKNVWDFQWQFACKINSLLVIVPNQNLVINLGIGNEATNTISTQSPATGLTLEEMSFPLHHPEYMMTDIRRDQHVFWKYHTSASSRLKSTLKRLIPKSIIENVLKPMIGKT